MLDVEDPTLPPGIGLVLTPVWSTHFPTVQCIVVEPAMKSLSEVVYFLSHTVLVLEDL